jgi:hypothetical protein
MYAVASTSHLESIPRQGSGTGFIGDVMRKIPELPGWVGKQLSSSAVQQFSSIS